MGNFYYNFAISIITCLQVVPKLQASFYDLEKTIPQKLGLILDTKSLC